jgi:hypothetical protein
MTRVLGRVTSVDILFAPQFNALKRSTKDWILNICTFHSVQRSQNRIANLRNLYAFGIHGRYRSEYGSYLQERMLLFQCGNVGVLSTLDLQGEFAELA